VEILTRNVRKKPFRENFSEISCNPRLYPLGNFRKYGEISQVLVEDNLGLHKISEKISRNSFFLKLPVRISTVFGTKRNKFQVKQMSIRLGKKSNSFAHKRTFLPALAMMNKKFIANLVG